MLMPQESDKYPATHKLLLSSSDEIYVAIKIKNTDKIASIEHIFSHLTKGDTYAEFNQVYCIEDQYKKDTFGNETTYKEYFYQQRLLIVKVESIIAIYFLNNNA